MYRVTVRDNAGEFTTRIEALRDGFADLRPLGEEIAELLRDDMTEARLAGVDRHGRLIEEYAPLAASTLRHRRARGDFGVTPFVGRGGASRIIAEYMVVVDEPDPYRVVVTGGWPGLDWIKYHVDAGPRPYLPLRDFLGVTEAYDTLIHERADEYIHRIATGGR